MILMTHRSCRHICNYLPSDILNNQQYRTYQSVRVNYFFFKKKSPSHETRYIKLHLGQDTPSISTESYITFATIIDNLNNL